MRTMKIKTGDRVEVLAGKDRGKSGKVIQTFPPERRVVVEGLGRLTRHLRARGNQKGQLVTFWRPVDVSNVALLCPKCGKKTRVGAKTLDTGKRVRVCKKCHETI
ncbi:50S ribosomal protein L24 [Patescibacteria group bacterium]|nr:MAG: 50S ribosomal protein L24 [Patescibacteria group bacterium]